MKKRFSEEQTIGFLFAFVEENPITRDEIRTALWAEFNELREL